jgi:hypothetical protein
MLLLFGSLMLAAGCSTETSRAPKGQKAAIKDVTVAVSGMT